MVGINNLTIFAKTEENIVSLPLVSYMTWQFFSCSIQKCGSFKFLSACSGSFFCDEFWSGGSFLGGIFQGGVFQGGDFLGGDFLGGDF